MITTHASARGIQLSSDQQQVVDDIAAGENVLATGPAGSGKSTVLNHLRAKYGSRLSVAASTGIAALNVGGTTLNSFAGLGMGEDSADEIAARLLSNKPRAYRNITECDILAIDEISMVSGALFDKTDDVFRQVRECDQPFGGVQLICFGDFLQLAPIGRRGAPAQFAFESAAWHSADIQQRFFRKVYRQQDQAFADALGRLRVGDIHHPSVDLIGARNNIAAPDDGIRPVIIHTHNADVTRINHVELASLPGQETIIRSVDTGGAEAQERLDRDCLAPRELRLKKNAQVMLLTNLDLDAGLVNGSLGKVIEIKKTTILVQFGKRAPIEITTHKWEITNNGKVLADREQFPLRLAYALTCHKVQGLTIDRIECHLAGCFEFGQGYVAVSRARTIDGLFLRKSTRHNFKAHPAALEFYGESV